MTALGKRVVRAEAQRLAGAVMAARTSWPEKTHDAAIRNLTRRLLPPLFRPLVRVSARVSPAVWRGRCSRFSATAAAIWRARASPLALLRFAAHVTADWLTTRFVRGGHASGPRAATTAPRSFVTEWACTLGIYLFVTTTLVQAYVIPTGSMEGTLRVGDHMLVDRVTFAPIQGRSAAISCRIAKWSAAISWPSCTPKTLARLT